MYWKWSFAVPVLLLLVLATDGIAQSVPLTITFPEQNHAVTSVGFPGVTDSVFVPMEGTRIQYRVMRTLDGEGDPLPEPYPNAIGPDTDGRYRFVLRYTMGAGGNFVETLSLAPQATCTDPTKSEGAITRIACSVVERGRGVTCSTVYDQMNQPPNQCKGTVACKKCNEIRVCGSNPQCY